MISWSSLNKMAGNQISERQTEENYWQDAEKKDVVNISYSQKGDDFRR